MAVVDEDEGEEEVEDDWDEDDSLDDDGVLVAVDEPDEDEVCVVEAVPDENETEEEEAEEELDSVTDTLVDEADVLREVVCEVPLPKKVEESENDAKKPRGMEARGVIGPSERLELLSDISQSTTGSMEARFAYS